MSLRRKRWEEWKRRDVEACPPKDRAGYRRLLDSVPMPTPEERMRMERVGRMVGKVFGDGADGGKRHGRKR